MFRADTRPHPDLRVLVDETLVANDLKGSAIRIELGSIVSVEQDTSPILRGRGHVKRFEGRCAGRIEDSPAEREAKHGARDCSDEDRRH